MDYQALLKGIELGELAPLTSYNQFLKNAKGIFVNGERIIHYKKDPARAYFWRLFLEHFPVTRVGRKGWESEELKFTGMYREGDGEAGSNFGLMFDGDNYQSFQIPPAYEKHRLRCACDPRIAVYISRISNNGKGKKSLERHIFLRVAPEYNGVPFNETYTGSRGLFGHKNF